MWHSATLLSNACSSYRIAALSALESKMHVDMDLNTKAVRHVTENDQVVNNILKGLEKTIIDLSHTNESESTPKDTREINEIDLCVLHVAFSHFTF
jgi:hypothetical protein